MLRTMDSSITTRRTRTGITPYGTKTARNAERTPALDSFRLLVSTTCCHPRYDPRQRHYPHPRRTGAAKRTSQQRRRKLVAYRRQLLELNSLRAFRHRPTMAGNSIPWLTARHSRGNQPGTSHRRMHLPVPTHCRLRPSAPNRSGALQPQLQSPRRLLGMKPPHRSQAIARPLHHPPLSKSP